MNVKDAGLAAVSLSRTGVPATPVPGSPPAGTPSSKPSSLDGLSNNLVSLTGQTLKTLDAKALDPGKAGAGFSAASVKANPASTDHGESKPSFPPGGFSLKDVQETFNHLNGMNSKDGIDIKVVGQHPHHANLAAAYQAYAQDPRFDATRRADAAKFAEAEGKRANELAFLADAAFVAQQDGNAKKLTFAEVKTLDLNNDGFVTADEVGTNRAKYPELKVPETEAKPAAKPNLAPGEFDLIAVQKTLYQIDNKTRAGQVTPDMITKAINTSERKLLILNDIMADPLLKSQFGGDHSVPEAIDREKGTVKNGQFLLKNFSQIAPQDSMQMMKDLQKMTPEVMKDIAVKGSTLSGDDLKIVAGIDGKPTIISPVDLGNAMGSPPTGSPPTGSPPPGSPPPGAPPAGVPPSQDQQLLDLVKRRNEMFLAVQNLQKDPNSLKILDSLGELMGRGAKDGKFSDFGLFELAKLGADDMMWQALQVNSGLTLSNDERARLAAFAKTITQVATDEDNISVITGEKRGQNMVFDPGDIQRWLDTHKYWQLPNIPTGPA